MAVEGHPAGLPQLTLDSIFHRMGEMVSHGQREQNCIYSSGTESFTAISILSHLRQLTVSLKTSFSAR